METRREPRQEEDDDPSTISPINFGSQVAQIITGAFTGNIDSIIKGSFGFIQDSNVNKLSHNTWETLKGNPTETPPWQTTTTREVEPPLEAQSAPQQQKEAAPAPASIPSSPSAAQAGIVPPSLPASPEINYPPSGPQRYPTRSPARTTQPTYATLAPLSVVEGVTTYEADDTSTNPPTSTDADDDDGDEAEGASAEVAGASTSSAVTVEPVAPEISTAATDAETTTEDDEQDFFENLIY